MSDNSGIQIPSEIAHLLAERESIWQAYAETKQNVEKLEKLAQNAHIALDNSDLRIVKLSPTGTVGKEIDAVIKELDNNSQESQAVKSAILSTKLKIDEAENQSARRRLLLWIAIGGVILLILYIILHLS